MMGSSASTFSALLPLWPERSAISAIKVPRKVVLAAVIRPMNKVFQATPQRLPSLMQASPKLRSLKTRPTMAVHCNWLSSVKKAPASALVTG
ncbi:hypothetical protein D3C72_1912510 [compost metagenome]